MDINWASVVVNVIALLAVLVPSLNIYLAKIKKIAEQGAVVGREIQEFNLVVVEALADDNIDNEEINEIVKEAKDIAAATKELWRLIKSISKPPVK